MDETSKTRRVWGELETSVLSGKGIDIGCGPDPVSPDVRRFDMEDGDANEISQFVQERFDFVYSSHCLEHMHNPHHAVQEWWKLVKPGGHLFFLVPDEDLYEQGVFPSRFNPDHKATFTISKAQSWSPVSVNVLDLARSLPNSELISLVLHDHGYDRSLLRFGPVKPPTAADWYFLKIYQKLVRRGVPRIPLVEKMLGRRFVIDQTLGPGILGQGPHGHREGSHVLAQIQCIVRKTV